MSHQGGREQQQYQRLVTVCNGTTNLRQGTTNNVECPQEIFKIYKGCRALLQELRKAKATVEEWKVSSSGQDDKADSLGVGAGVYFKDLGDKIQEDDTELEDTTYPLESLSSLSLSTNTFMFRLEKKKEKN